MITLLAIMLFVVLAFLAVLVVLVSKLVEGTASIAPNTYRGRTGIDEVLRELRDLSPTIDRIELHVRGPAGKYGPAPAATSSIDPTEVEPNL